MKTSDIEVQAVAAGESLADIELAKALAKPGVRLIDGRIVQDGEPSGALNLRWNLAKVQDLLRKGR